MKANFGLGLATGTEGLMYPIPYSSARDVVDLSVYAEKLGFHSVWGNDHITTQNYVREEFDNKPPRYYAPLLELAAIAERTTTLKLATALLVIPFRNPLVMAKEIATLDQLSGGRVMLGVGLGAYREEFEAEFGANAEGMVRGEMLDESYLPRQGITQCSASFLVPEGCVFFMGDNRTGSNDARFWKQPYISVDNIRAKVMVGISVLPDNSWRGVRVIH